MANFTIEGEWKDFVFKMVKPADYRKVLELLRTSFYPNETLCNQFGNFDGIAEDFEETVTSALDENLSFLAEHIGTGKVAGVRILSIIRKNGGHDDSSTFKTSENDIIISFLTKATADAGVFQNYPDIDFYGDFFMTATAPEFRGQGLATEMYKRAIELLRSKNVKVCKSVLTSPYTLKACQNLQFTELAQLYLKDHKDSNGTCLFPKAGDLSVTVMAKRIL